jgi:hypothetical protein
MVMSERSTVVGVFTDDVYADLAADELRRVGFSDDEVSVVKHKAGSGGILNNLKSLFTSQEGVIQSADDFIHMGVPERDASYFKKELDAGRTIELVRVAGQQQEVLEILRHYGAKVSRNSNQDAHAENDYPDTVQGKNDPISHRKDDYYTSPPED